ncbi:SpoIIE family protein phosphatase [Actinacidiphila alni]|uniref:SpoIIE family protein phosphatase n=1 Tax=Actinacidiphila alni TaxID=380248 RepID=UPI000B899BEF|nr:SpoIIE family protein phosphatase [Actinacidiphila alni]
MTPGRHCGRRAGKTFAPRPPPLLIRNHQVVPDALASPPQPPLGIAAQLGAGPRQINETRLLPGGRVLLYTDGVTEARMTDGTLFGMERFTEAIVRATVAGELPSAPACR